MASASESAYSPSEASDNDSEHESGQRKGEEDGRRRRRQHKKKSLAPTAKTQRISREKHSETSSPATVPLPAQHRETTLSVQLTPLPRTPPSFVAPPENPKPNSVLGALFVYNRPKVISEKQVEMCRLSETRRTTWSSGRRTSSCSRRSTSNDCEHPHWREIKGPLLMRNMLCDSGTIITRDSYASSLVLSNGESPFMMNFSFLSL